MRKDAKIFCAGHRGLLGSAILRKLKEQGYNNFILKTSREVDLRRQEEVEQLFEQEMPEYVFMAAACVGGIHANNIYRAEFIFNNLLMCANVIHAAWLNKTKKLLMLGSNCIYPKAAAQPIKEEYLLTGELEPTNEPYAIAKVAAIKMCEAYREQYGFNAISGMPCNLMGIGDTYNLERCHVLPALIRKIHEAKITNKSFIEVWGTGIARREFLFADDCAEACIFLMNNYDGKEIVNIGSGVDYEIKEVVKIASKVIGYKGDIVFDSTKPDGTLKKLLDVGKINNLGWHSSTPLTEAIKITYEDFKLRYG